MAWPGLAWPLRPLTHFLNILTVWRTQVVYALTYILLASILTEARQLSVKHDKAGRPDGAAGLSANCGC